MYIQADTDTTGTSAVGWVHNALYFCMASQSQQICRDMWAVKFFQLCYTSILKVPHNYGDIISHRFSGAFWITGFDEIFFLRIKKGVEFRQQLLQRIEHPLSHVPLVASRSSIFMLPALRSIVDCLKGGVHLPSSVMNSSLCEGKYVSYPFYCRTLEIASMSIGCILYCVWNIPVL